jgi:prevent-host-death family protein
MAITTMSSREFNQDASKAKRAAEAGPVFITDRGRPSHVLMTIEEYQRITSSHTNIVDMLAMPGSEHIELEAARFRGPLRKPPDLS